MSFPDDLLELAHDLQRREPEPKQAALRRSVSTAYYALFHLLIDDAVNNWAVQRHRLALARAFEHHRMKAACVAVVQRINGGEKLPSDLYTVAKAFVNLQALRNTADYDSSKHWSSIDVSEALTTKPLRIFCCCFSCQGRLANRVLTVRGSPVR